MMCPPYTCGPLCHEKDVNCFINNSTGEGVPIPSTSDIIDGLLTPDSENCPPNCCSTQNEICLRSYDVSGLEIELDTEVSILKLTFI